MSENIDEPVVVVRRRRKIIRQHREKTPEPSAKSGVKQKYSDDDSSTAEQNNNDTEKATTRTAATTTTTATPMSKSRSASTGMSAHRSKILSRRDKAVGTAAVRSQSQPRPADEQKSLNSEIMSIYRNVKRSLSSSSSSRHKKQDTAESNDSVPSSPQFERENAPVREIPALDNKSINSTSSSESTELSKLEQNLRRFEAERRKFELEKKKFDKEKREMDKIRYRRLEDFERKRLERKIEEAKNAESAGASTTADEHENLYKVFSVIEQKTKLQNAKTEKIGTVSPVSIIATPPPQVIIKQPSDDKVEEITATKPVPPPRLIPPKKIEQPDDSITVESFDISQPSESPDVCDDYESSTALSSSSRENDFDDEDFAHFTLAQANAKKNENLSISEEQVTVKRSWLARLFGRKTNLAKDQKIKEKPIKLIAEKDLRKPMTFTKFFFVESRVVWRKLLADHPEEWAATMRMRNKCIADLIVMIIFCGFGGLIFRFVEGAFENFYKCGVRRVKRDFVDNLWLSSHNLREDDWKNVARLKLRKFEEELHAAHDAGMTSYSGMKSWSFINAIIYCMTVVTTIGYGHIYPSTNTGRAITIVYAIIGIPIFLILLADFGKLFTRGIKFLWAYVRRLYYTGSLRKVRKQAQVQEVLRVMNMSYEIATFRRPSMFKEQDIENAAATPQSATASHLTAPSNDTPTTPMPPELDIDDEFNLPISLAFVILLAYIFCGASVYSIWEEWSFFEACYFVFISMSTIGFGDYVPKHPIYMMTSIIYLVFGLALTSMCINVVQLKLSDTFRQASAKIGATIGLSMAEEEARSTQNATPQTAADMPAVHQTGQNQSDDDKNNITIEPPPPPPLLPKRTDKPAAEENNTKTKAKKKSKK